MASIRKTKKGFRYACGELAGELLVASHSIEDFKHEVTPEIIGQIAALQVDALTKCSFAFDKSKKDFADLKAYRKAKKAYSAAAFRKLHEEVANRMQSIVDSMNAAMPQRIREALKDA